MQPDSRPFVSFPASPMGERDSDEHREALLADLSRQESVVANSAKNAEIRAQDKPLPQARERCGAWVEVGGHETVCMLWAGHEGSCAPLRSELMDAAEWREKEAQAIHDAVLRRDAFGRWPYEGPNEAAE